VYVPDLRGTREIPGTLLDTGTVPTACIRFGPTIHSVHAAGPCCGENQDIVFNSPISYYDTMAERFVEIPVPRQVRDYIKKEKGILTYEQFFRKLFQI
jgi:hypothetical protein